MVDKWQYHLAYHLLIQLVLTLKTLALWIVLMEEVVGVARLVVDAEESPHMLAVLVGKVLELLPLYLVVVLYDFPSDAEGLLVVLSAIKKLVFASLEHMTHG